MNQAGTMELRNEIASDDLVVTFLNMSKQNLLRYAAKLLEPPYSVPIQTVDIKFRKIYSSIIEAFDRKYRYSADLLESVEDECDESYDKVLSISRAVVLSDSYFFEDSILHDTVSFHTRGGKDAIVDFYNEGGTVVVFCEEGIYDIGSILSESFECNWKHGGVTTETCVPTEVATTLLGSDIAKNIEVNEGHFMAVPDGEGLYGVEMLSFEKYVQARFSFNLDEDDGDDNDPQDDQAAYNRYQQANASKHLVVLHRNPKGGRLIWLGDRKQEDPNLRAILAKLCFG